MFDIIREAKETGSSKSTKETSSSKNPNLTTQSSSDSTGQGTNVGGGGGGTGSTAIPSYNITFFPLSDGKMASNLKRRYESQVKIQF